MPIWLKCEPQGALSSQVEKCQPSYDCIQSGAAMVLVFRQLRLPTVVIQKQGTFLHPCTEWEEENIQIPSISLQDE